MFLIFQINNKPFLLFFHKHPILFILLMGFSFFCLSFQIWFVVKENQNFEDRILLFDLHVNIVSIQIEENIT